MRVLVCGSRDWDDREAVGVVLDGYLDRAVANFDDLVVIEGGATGADRCAAEWYGGQVDGQHAIHDLVRHESYPADWDRHGKAAGPIRNQQMLDEGKPDIVWAFKSKPESRGTDHMISIARKAGIPVYVVLRP